MQNTISLISEVVKELGPEPATMRGHEATLTAYLENNDMAGWHAACEAINATFPDASFQQITLLDRYWLAHLSQWFRSNTVLAVEEKREVLQAWSNTVPRIRRDGIFHGLLARALEHLPDAQKIDVLQGQAASKSGMELHDSFRRGKNRGYWSVSSPAWVGAPGTPLRQAAVAAGWSMSMLPIQVQRAFKNMLEATPTQTQEPTWASWVAYPHSAAVLAELRAIARPSNTPAPHSCSVPSMPWAQRRDIALARAIAENGPEQFRCTVGEGTFPCTAQEQKALYAMVQVYSGLGLWQDLEIAVLQGTIEGISTEREVFTPQHGFLAPDVHTGI